MNRLKIAINDKPEMYVSEITNQDNIGILMKDGKRKVITTDGQYFNVLCPMDNTVNPGTLPIKVRASKRELIRYHRDNNKHSIEEMFKFDSSKDLMDWAVCTGDSRKDITYL